MVCYDLDRRKAGELLILSIDTDFKLFDNERRCLRLRLSISNTRAGIEWIVCRWLEKRGV